MKRATVHYQIGQGQGCYESSVYYEDVTDLQVAEGVVVIKFNKEDSAIWPLSRIISVVTDNVENIR